MDVQLPLVVDTEQIMTIKSDEFPVPSLLPNSAPHVFMQATGEAISTILANLTGSLRSTSSSLRRQLDVDRSMLRRAYHERTQGSFSKVLRDISTEPHVADLRAFCSMLTIEALRLYDLWSASISPTTHTSEARASLEHWLRTAPSVDALRVLRLSN